MHAWRAILYALRNRMNDEGDAEALSRGRAAIAEAQRQDPANVLALGAETLFGDALPVARAEQATTAHPDDWLAWYLLSEAHARAADDKARWAAAKEALRRAQANPSIRLMETMQGKRKPRWGHEDKPANASPPSSAR